MDCSHCTYNKWRLNCFRRVVAQLRSSMLRDSAADDVCGLVFSILFCPSDDRHARGRDCSAERLLSSAHGEGHIWPMPMFYGVIGMP